MLAGNRKGWGFTIVELMVTVAIIGILAALVIPIYQDYLARTQVSEAVSLGAAFKVPVAEYGASHQIWPTAIVSSAGTTVGATEIAGTITGKYSVVSPVVAGSYPDGTLTISMSKGRANGTILFVTTDGGATWTCSLGTVEDRFRPHACR